MDCDWYNNIPEMPECTDSFGYFIGKLDNMAKKVNIEDDLSEILDRFLEKLNESQQYLSNGIFNTNFAEAALLLQSAANVYGKKVDALWEYTLKCQERIVLNNDKVDVNEVNKLEERINRNKRKKRKIQVEPQVEITPPPQEVVPNTEEEVTGLLESVNSDENNNFHRNDDRRFMADPKIYLTNINGTLSDEFVENNEESERERREAEERKRKEEEEEVARALGDRDIKEIIERMREKSSGNTNSQENSSSREEHKVIDLDEGKIPHDKFRLLEGPYFHEFVKLPSNLISIDTGIPDDKEWVNTNNLQLPHSHTQLKVNIELFEKLGLECNVEYSKCVLFPEIVEKFVQDHNLTSEDLHEDKMLQTFIDYLDNYIVTDEVADNVVARIKSRRSTSRYGQNELLQDVSVKIPRLSNDTIKFYVNKLGKELRECEENEGDQDLPVKTQDSGFFDDSQTELDVDQSKLQNKSHTESHLLVTQSESHDDDCHDTDDCHEDFSLDAPIVTSTPKTTKSMKTPRKSERTDEVKIERKKRIKLGKTTTVSLKSYEYFYYNNYQPEDGEGEILQPEFPDSDDDDTGANTGLDTETIADVDSALANDDTITNCSVTQTHDHDHTTSIKEATIVEEPKEVTMQDIIRAKTAELRKDPRLASRYQYLEWRQFIIEKLKDVEGNSDFDIHEYGSHILNAFPENGLLRFDDFVQGRTSSVVTKYFLASLQLANTNNIDFCPVPTNILANSHLKIKLLSKERHHEHLTDYVAPSVEVLPEKLLQVQEVLEKQQPKHNMVSIPVTPRTYRSKSITIKPTAKVSKKYRSSTGTTPKYIKKSKFPPANIEAMSESVLGVPLSLDSGIGTISTPLTEPTVEYCSIDLTTDSPTGTCPSTSELISKTSQSYQPSIDVISKPVPGTFSSISPVPGTSRNHHFSTEATTSLPGASQSYDSSNEPKPCSGENSATKKKNSHNSDEDYNLYIDPQPSCSRSYRHSVSKKRLYYSDDSSDDDY